MNPKIEMPSVRPENLIGSWRRFGPTGPLYQVTDVALSGSDQPLMRVRVVETGEELDYRLMQIFDDPEG